MIDSKPLVDAIASKRLVEVVYNRMRMKFAPHIVYTRHGALFLDAVPVERDGKSLIDPRLATFKLAGLELVQVTTTSFTPFPGFDAGDPKYGESPPVAVV